MAVRRPNLSIAQKELALAAAVNVRSESDAPAPVHPARHHRDGQLSSQLRELAMKYDIVLVTPKAPPCAPPCPPFNGIVDYLDIPSVPTRSGIIERIDTGSRS